MKFSILALTAAAVAQTSYTNGTSPAAPTGSSTNISSQLSSLPASSSSASPYISSPILQSSVASDPAITSPAIRSNATNTAAPTTSGRLTVTETLTTEQTITSCKGGCTKGQTSSTYVEELTITTTFCPDTVSPTETVASTEASHSTTTQTLTTQEVITTCPGGCKNGQQPGTVTRDVTLTTTYCPDSTIPAPVPTSEAPAPAPSSTTSTCIATVTTCPGGCSNGATTYISKVTRTTTWCPSSASATPEEPTQPLPTEISSAEVKITSAPETHSQAKPTSHTSSAPIEDSTSHSDVFTANSAVQFTAESSLLVAVAALLF